jgi:mannose-6-phosphate isomerase-like protein (cupin superfamily)
VCGRCSPNRIARFVFHDLDFAVRILDAKLLIAPERRSDHWPFPDQRGLSSKRLRRPRTAPPPHVHSREDELFYVLEGEFDVYVGDQAFTVQTGECIFLPRTKPHGWVIRSARFRMLTLFTREGSKEPSAVRVRLPGIWIFRPGSSPTRRTI